MKNPLIENPLYKFEEWNAEAGILQIGIGDLVFEMTPVLGRFAWRACTAESMSWPKSKRRYGVIASSPIWYSRRGNAEKAMRLFIESVLSVKGGKRRRPLSHGPSE